MSEIINIIVKMSGKEVTEESKRISKSLKSIGSELTSVGTTMSMAFTAPIVAGFGLAIKSASDLTETANKIDAVFGDAAVAVNAFAQDAATELGQSKQQALDAAATFGIFGKAAGLAGSDLSGFSTQLVSLSSDLASFYNTSPEEAILAIGAAMRGEMEPIRKYGVLLDDATMRQKAFEMGLVTTTKEALEPQTKVLVAQALILEQTAVAQGDFARTSDGLANTSRILQAELANVAAEMGMQLLPIALELATALKGVLDVFTGMSPEMQKTVLIVMGIVAAIGPLLIVTGQLMTAYAALMPVFTAVAGVLTGPVALAIAAVVAAVILLYVAWTQNWGGIQQITASVVAAITSVFNAWLTNMQRLFGIFQLAFEGKWYEFGQELRKMWDDVWAGIVKGLSAAWEFISTAVSQGVDNIIKWFQDVDWAEVGTNIIQGIANGISAGASTIANAAKSAAAAALAAAKGFLGIESPSKVFAGVGANMMAGMAQGINQTAGLPAGAALGAAQNVTSRVTNHNYNINANYQNQSPSSILSDIRMLELLHS